MNPTLSRHCPQCKQYQTVSIVNPGELVCPGCAEKWGRIDPKIPWFEKCPVCTCRQFYITKDFNQFLGFAILLVGIVLVPWTFGLSMPIFALLDWLLYRRVPVVTCCYRCGSEFRNAKSDKSFKPFMHHIGLKYDKYRK